MKLTNLRTGEQVAAQIKEMIEEDYERLANDKRFSFDWTTEQNFEVYKLFLPKNKKIMGLISLWDIPNEKRIEIHLLEISTDSRGSKKKIDDVAGCLIAYACELAFSRAYEGFVSLVPKTRLILHYQQKYGFVPFGKQLAIYSEAAKTLIIKYLHHEK